MAFEGSVARKRWDFVLGATSNTSPTAKSPGGGEHSVVVFHDIVSGRLRIRLDNAVVYERQRKLWDTGGRFGPFGVLGHSTSGTPKGPCVTVVVKDSLWKGFVYACFVDGVQVEEHALTARGSRNLREMKEGSYIISTGKRTAHSLRNIKRTWAFELRERRTPPRSRRCSPSC